MSRLRSSCGLTPCLTTFYLFTKCIIPLIDIGFPFLFSFHSKWWRRDFSDYTKLPPATFSHIPTYVIALKISTVVILNLSWIPLGKLMLCGSTKILLQVVSLPQAHGMYSVQNLQDQTWYCWYLNYLRALILRNLGGYDWGPGHHLWGVQEGRQKFFCCYRENQWRWLVNVLTWTCCFSSRLLRLSK